MSSKADVVTLDLPTDPGLGPVEEEARSPPSLGRTSCRPSSPYAIATPQDPLPFHRRDHRRPPGRGVQVRQEGATGRPLFEGRPIDDRVEDGEEASGVGTATSAMMRDGSWIISRAKPVAIVPFLQAALEVARFDAKEGFEAEQPDQADDGGDR